MERGKRGSLRPGDVVAINKAGFEEPAFTPRTLLELGYPNRFTVVRAGLWKGEIDAVVLDECCGNFLDFFCLACEESVGTAKQGEASSCPKCGANGQVIERPLCCAHPVELFDLVGHEEAVTTRERMEEEHPDGEIAVTTPWGKLLHIAHFRGQEGKASELIGDLPILGGVKIKGPVADVLGDLMRKHHII